jgi:beta-RFAP synthase
MSPTPPTVQPGEDIRITTGSRLHFGLLDTAAPFGGVGVMIDRPTTEVVVSPAEEFSCDHAVDRVSAIADRLCEQIGEVNRPACRVQVQQRSQPHHGLGTGTQLAMAVAEGLARFIGHDFDGEFLATQIAMRAKRSAVGSHGYFHGGMIFESQRDNSEINCLQRHIALPTQWRVIVFRPTVAGATVSGTAEQGQFDRLGRSSNSQRQELLCIVVDELLPAAEQADFQKFCDALHRYNYHSGKLFQPVQGGPYSSPAIAELIATLLTCGARGIGQSSWGPSVFCWFDTPQSANAFAKKMEPLGLPMFQCQVRNRPRTIVPSA